MPKVSVIIPTYNRPEMVKNAVQSVLNQTYRDLEVIVVDDGMDRRAGEGLKMIEDDRVVYIQHEKSLGGGAARNTGIIKSRGEYIALLDDDDEWMPTKLEKQMVLLEETGQNVAFSFTAIKELGGSDNERNNVPSGVGDYHELALSRFNCFLTVVLVIRRDAFEGVGGFDEDFKSHQETDLMIRITSKYRGVGINEPLVAVNMGINHDQLGKNWNHRIQGREMIVKKHLKEYKKIPKILAKHYFELGLFYRNNLQYRKAREPMKSALRYDFKFLYLVHLINVYLNNKLIKIFKISGLK